jgi:hypothetical protein
MNCHKHGLTEHSLIGIVSQRWKCKKCSNEYSYKFVRSLKVRGVEYKGGCCVKCGYNKCIRALEFHHLNPDEKDFTIGERAHGKKIVKKWSLIQKELDKCILICRNCHAEIHHESLVIEWGSLSVIMLIIRLINRVGLLCQTVRIGLRSHHVVHAQPKALSRTINGFLSQRRMGMCQWLCAVYASTK